MYASFVPGPQSIWRSTSKLPPGTSLAVSAEDVATGVLPAPVPFWRLTDHVQRAAGIDDGEAIDRLDALLRATVARQMVADVPLGAFLSGGVDSSTVVALMQAQSTRPVKTFTIGIPDDAGLDESFSQRPWPLTSAPITTRCRSPLPTLALSFLRWARCTTSR